MQDRKFNFLKLFLITLLLSATFSFAQSTSDSFRFTVMADTRDNAGEENDSREYFRGVLEALKIVGAGEFMLTPGDMDPPQDIRWSIDKYLGKDYIWYPVLGNHEEETESDMEYLRQYNAGGNKLPYIVNMGPKGTEETMYSLDFGNSHFIVLNQYYDGTCDVCVDGDINDPIYEWLKNDLEKTDKTNIFIFGHEPAFVQPEKYNGRIRHNGDSLDKYRNNRDRFWKLLEDEKVLAYFCGHTHNFSAILINNVWQIDAGHARGKGDTGAPSTFLTFDVDGNSVNMTVHRDIHNGNYNYKDIVKSFRIK